MFWSTAFRLRGEASFPLPSAYARKAVQHGRAGRSALPTERLCAEDRAGVYPPQAGLYSKNEREFLNI